MSDLRNSTSFQSFLVLVLVIFLIVPAQAQYSGGTGEPNNPYQIATAEDLIALGNELNDYDKHFIMTADINLAGYVFEDGSVIPMQYSPPFGGPPFTGVIDGNNHIISNLSIQGGYGLFKSIRNAKIINLGLINFTVDGGNNVGALAGETIESIIYKCYTNGFISGTRCVGGLIGTNSNSTVIQSYSIGTVDGYSFVGGLIGENTGSLIYCYSKATVSGQASIGGLVGGNGGLYYSSPVGSAELLQCYSTGEVIGHYDIGGLVGYNNGGYVNQCYSTGIINDYLSKYESDIGGLVGRIDSGFIANSFWDVETSGLTTSAGGIGMTTNEMSDPNTFIMAGWDFVGEIQNGTNEVWQIPQGDGYPKLSFFNGYVPTQLNGLGTTDNPYLVSDTNELGAIIHFNSTANFKLSNSIDLSGINWSTAIIPYFEGKFDGDNFTISNMTIEGTGHIGLFGTLFPNSELKNTGVTNVNINCLGNYSGGIVGYNCGTITQCYIVSGTMRNNDCIGGLAGFNNGNIFNCYSNTVIDSNNFSGGLVGYNKCNINNCYSNTTVDSNYYAGGIIGNNSDLGSVDKCYSTGKVTSTQKYATGGLIGSNSNSYSPKNSFWDIETSGQTRSDGRISGSGKTTIDMQKENTFTKANWDFVGETDNGTEDIWTICEGTNYPRFVWQIRDGDLVCPDGIAMEDFDFFMDHWEDSNCDSTNNYCDGTDLDFSGTVDINDFVILIDNWLAENP